MNAPHEGVKDIALDIWKNNRAFAIALIVVAAAAGFWLWQKRRAATMVAPTTGAPMQPLGPGGSFINTYETTTITNPAPPMMPVPPPISIPPIPTPHAPGGGRPAWLPAIPNGSRLIQSWGGLPWGWQAPGSKTINGLNPPPGTKIWQGSQGRWWYAIPGGAQQLLTTN